MGIGNLTQQEILETIYVLLEVKGERKGFTTEELCNAMQIRENKARKIIRVLIKSGEFACRKIPGKSISDSNILVPEYYPVVGNTKSN